MHQLLEEANDDKRGWDLIEIFVCRGRPKEMGQKRKTKVVEA
ncbi:MAG TPA: hypothetical protein VJH63_01725 [Candidatus Paceibacterota bacterium]